jgi:hypothetical protein
MKTTPRRLPRMYATLLWAYLFLWLSLTVLDLLTTLHALKLGYREMNPHTDFSTLQTLVLPEVVIGIVGGVVFSAGFFLCREQMENSSSNFDIFRKTMFPVRLNASVLLVGPLAAVMVRGVVVMNNLVLIASGFPAIESVRVFMSSLGIPISATGVLFNSIVTFFMFKPAVYVIYLVIKKSGLNARLKSKESD